MYVRSAEVSEFVEVERIGRFSLPLYYKRHELYANTVNGNWDVRVLIEQNHDQVAGFVVVSVHQYPQYIMSIAVDKPYRRRGGCSMLLQHVMKNSTALLLHVDTQNQAALKCYMKNGFIVFTKKLNYYHSLGRDAFLMTWSKKQ